MVVTLTSIFLLGPWITYADIPECDPRPELTEVSAVYPPMESPRPTEGYALIEVTINEEGAVVNTKLIESGSRPRSKAFSRRFGRLALEAVAKWKYSPVETQCRMLQKVAFTFKE